MMKPEGVHMKRIICLLAAALCACTAKEPAGNIMDGDGMLRDFFSYDLKGRWIRIDDDAAEELIFEKDTVTMIHSDGRTETFPYYVNDGSELQNDDHTIFIEAEGLPYDELIYQDHQTEKGLKGYLFAVWAVTGGRDPFETVMVFQREDDRNHYTPDNVPERLGVPEEEEREYPPGGEASDYIPLLGEMWEDAALPEFIRQYDSNSVIFAGTLFGYPADILYTEFLRTGRFHEITCYVHDMNYEEFHEVLKERYGEAVWSGEKENGPAAEYRKDGLQIDLWHDTAQNYVRVTFRRIKE